MPDNVQPGANNGHGAGAAGTGIIGTGGDNPPPDPAKAGRGGRQRPPAGDARNAFAGIVVVVECIGGKNMRVPHSPTTVLRCEWDVLGNLPKHSLRDGFESFPSKIPGQWVSFNGDTRVLEIVDPMGEQENRAAMKLLSQVMKTNNLGEVGPAENRKVLVTDDNTAKEWLYSLRRFFDIGNMRIVAGRMPAMDYIEKLPGRVRHHMGHRNPAVANSREASPVPYITADQLRENRVVTAAHEKPTISTDALLARLQNADAEADTGEE